MFNEKLFFWSDLSRNRAPEHELFFWRSVNPSNQKGQSQQQILPFQKNFKLSI